MLDLLVEDWCLARPTIGVLQRGVTGGARRAPILSTPWMRGRRLSSAMRALPSPRCRRFEASATSVIQARSPCVCAAAIPAGSSPTTAGSPVRSAALTSETGKTGGASSCRSWSRIWIAPPGSSSRKSRNRHVGIVRHLGGAPVMCCRTAATVPPLHILRADRTPVEREAAARSLSAGPSRFGGFSGYCGAAHPVKVNFRAIKRDPPGCACNASSGRT